MTIAAHPLCWPTGWKRTEPWARVEAKFGRARKQDWKGEWTSARALTLNEGLERVLAELQRMCVDRQDVVVSTNVRTRLDGMPWSGEPEPSDPGAAVYWEEKGGARRVMAIDIYDRVADNLAAIAATLDAMRAIERHGGAAVLERAFTGFVALPAPGAKREWWDVLQCRRDSSIDVVRAQYRRLASENHPDKPGGNPARMAEINTAYDEAKEAVKQ